MLFSKKNNFHLAFTIVSLLLPLLSGGCGDKQISHDTRMATFDQAGDPRAQQVEDLSADSIVHAAISNDSQDKLQGMASRDEKSSLSVVELIESIDSLPMPESHNEEPQPLCDEKAKVDEQGLCQKKQTIGSGDTALVCSIQKYSLEKIPEEFIALNPNADALWPGALIQSKPLLSGILDPVPITDRTAGDITMTLATSSNGSFSMALEKPSLASATEAIKQILNTNVGMNTPAKFHYKSTRVYSKEHLAFAMGIDVKTSFNFDVNARFNYDATDQYNRVLVEFNQEYYTMAFTPYEGVNGFFMSNVETKDISPYTKAGNPLAYIASVTYGRKIYLLFESKAKFVDIEAAITANFQGNGISVGGNFSTKYKKILDESKIKAYVIGGNAQSALASLTAVDDKGGTMVDLKRLLVGGANFSNGNAGVPISFTVRHVKDSSQLKTQLATVYHARECYANSDTSKPATWNLKITLNRVAIQQENGFCEPPLNEHGEFSSCLNIHIKDMGETIPVFCEQDVRKAKAGDTINYGEANHSLIIPVHQKPGNVITVYGLVQEEDDQDVEEILNFENNFELSQSYEWMGWRPEISATGVHNGCKATLFYNMEWLSERP